jgi:hypothetical protein
MSSLKAIETAASAILSLTSKAIGVAACGDWVVQDSTTRRPEACAAPHPCSTTPPSSPSPANLAGTQFREGSVTADFSVPSRR